MIQATVTGNVGKRPELRQSRAGKPMASFSVASTLKREGQEPHTTWVDVLVFDEQAERCAEELDKGDRVVVSGRLQLESYEKKDGGTGWVLKMLADEVGTSLRWGRKERATEPAGVGAEEPIPF